VSFTLRAPYLENNTIPEGQTVVAGTLMGSGQNATEGSGAVGVTVSTSGLIGMASIAIAFAVFL